MKPTTPSPPAAAAAAAAATDDPSPSASDSPSATFSVERRGDASASCRWTLPDFPRTRARTFYSRYFEVGGFDCRLLLYPRGDSQALPGYLSLYLQVLDPKTPTSSSSATTTTSSSKWECFLSYRLSVAHPTDPSKSLARDSWHRFSSKKRSHGWCDFAPSTAAAYLFPPHDSLVIAADISVLSEAASFAEADGRFTWKVLNFGTFREMVRTQKIMSPAFFPAANAGGSDCGLRISVYQSNVSDADHLSVCLESKEPLVQATSGSSASALPSSGGGSGVPDGDRGCWCLFRVSILNQRPGGSHIHKDSYGRFGADNASLGWGDYIKMDDFLAADGGYLLDGAVVFSASVHVIKESNSFTRSLPMIAGISGAGSGRAGARKSDGHFGKFIWRIENFTRLKELLKKRKITGLCIKSRKFQVGNRDCRLIVYPRGQSQPPCNLSVFLEVTDPRNSSEWSCFVSHRLSVINQKLEERTIVKESQNRYSKSAKDWGWREFVTLTVLFDQDAGFLVQDTVVFAAEVLILKETTTIQELSDEDSEACSSGSGCQIDSLPKRPSFMWKVENFLSFKDIMETRKIFSKYFQAGGCELRIGVYESFDTICIYLESDQPSGFDPDKNFWVHYKMAIINQKNSAKTVCKESSICTKTWNNSVLQFMKVSDLLDTDAGFLVRDTVVFVCEIIDCCPWFDFSDLEVLASDDDQDDLSTDPDDFIESEDSEDMSGDEEDMFRNLLSRAGFSLTYGENYTQPQVTLREKILTDASAIAGFLTGLRVYLDNPAKVKRMLLPTKVSTRAGGKKDVSKCDSSSTSLISLLMGVSVLKQAIIDLLLDIMVECCQPSEERPAYVSSSASSKTSPDSNGASSPPELNVEGELTECACSNKYERLKPGSDDIQHRLSVQNTDKCTNDIPARVLEQSCSPPEVSGADLLEDEGSDHASGTKWPEQSEELLGLIVSSLRALDSAVPHGCPEPRRRPQSIQKIALVLEKAPKKLQPDLVALVPKLVDSSEHSLAACALLDHLQKPDTEPSLRLPVFNALSELEFNCDIWKQASFHALELLADSNDEPLVEAITYVLKAASQCQHITQAARAVRWRLKDLGTEVPLCVLDFLSKTVHSWSDVADALLKDIDSDCEPDSSCLPMSCSTSSTDEFSAEGMHSLQGQAVHGKDHLSDVFILIEMLSIPRLFVEVSQVLQRALLQGAFGLELVAMVLERRHSHKLSLKSGTGTVVNDSQNKQVLLDGQFEHSPVQEDDFTSVLALGEVLSLSTETRVQDFVRMLYAIIFKIYTKDHYRYRILKGLVERATNTSDSCRAVDIDMDVLVFLVKEEFGIARPVLNMLREVAEVAQADRANLWHQICATEDENMRLREDMDMEQTKFTKEKDVLTQQLTESEAANAHLRSELKAEKDRFVREKKELSEQMLEMENQLEWVRSEKDEQIVKLTAEKKNLHDRLHEAETQLSHDINYFNKITKEKNALAERLKVAEASRKRIDDEFKRFVAEAQTREEIRKSLEGEVRRLTQTVGQTEGEKKEKEEQITRCEAYIDGMESKLQVCQQYIHTLETSIQEEMARHAPVYGVGVEALSLDELETLTNIHERGLRQIHAIRQRKGSSHRLSAPSLPHIPGLYSSPPSMAVGLPSSLIPTSSIAPNGAGTHGNGHMNGSMGNWFNPT
uniref:MATH domain-containing protein n=1 Tax=Oryza punctata TaxID=4537 RepID=A0A0E0K2C4_ORYPU